MQEISQLTEFGKVFIFLIVGILLVLLTFLLGKLIAPNHPNKIKNSSYECGEEPEGNSWVQFNSKFYVIALIFLLFDVEMVFVFPWATVFAQQQLIEADNRWGWLSFTEMFAFIGILMLGLVYVWRKKDLDWIKPKPIIPQTNVKIPKSIYDQINERPHTLLPFENIKKEPLKATEEIAVASKPKPAFKPTFRKPAP